MKEREAKKQKTIATVEGKRRESYEHGTKEEEEEDDDDDDDDNQEGGEGEDF